MSGRLRMILGHPMTDEEINFYYASSMAIWNAYHRTTQSGVLAKACMLGVPAIVKKDNLSEFSIESYNVVACEDNSIYEQLKKCLLSIINNHDMFSKNARTVFETKFDFRCHNKAMENLLADILDNHKQC